MNRSASCPIEKAEKLLLATDGSEFSEGAIREAIKFAAQWNGRQAGLTM